MGRATWGAPVSDAEAHARAGGRRHYNAWRRDLALYRRMRLMQIAGASGLNLWRHGAQAILARRLNVSRSTISRDIAALLREYQVGKPCPLCDCTARHRWRRLDYPGAHP